MFVNGVAQGSPTQFTVSVPAGEFLVGVSKQVAVQDFPVTGKITALTWQQSQQNFVIAGVTTKSLDPLSDEAGTTSSLENPQPGSFRERHRFALRLVLPRSIGHDSDRWRRAAQRTVWLGTR